MSTVEILEQVTTKLNDVRAALGQAGIGKDDVCLNCTFQADDVLPTTLALAIGDNKPHHG